MWYMVKSSDTIRAHIDAQVRSGDYIAVWEVSKNHDRRHSKALNIYASQRFAEAVESAIAQTRSDEKGIERLSNISRTGWVSVDLRVQAIKRLTDALVGWVEARKCETVLEGWISKLDKMANTENIPTEVKMAALDGAIEVSLALASARESDIEALRGNHRVYARSAARPFTRLSGMRVKL